MRFKDFNNACQWISPLTILCIFQEANLVNTKFKFISHVEKQFKISFLLLVFSNLFYDPVEHFTANPRKGRKLFNYAN